VLRRRRADGGGGGDEYMYKVIWDVPPKEMAEQLTVMDWHLYACIPLTEFLANGWDRPR
jgi:hypothetical protein